MKLIAYKFRIDAKAPTITQQRIERAIKDSKRCLLVAVYNVNPRTFELCLAFDRAQLRYGPDQALYDCAGFTLDGSSYTIIW